MSKKIKDKRKAKQQIMELFKKAENVFPQDKSSANKIVKKARRIAMKHQLRIPLSLKRRFCKHCYSYLMPGKNLRVRTQVGYVVYSCLECKKFMRFPYKK